MKIRSGNKPKRESGNKIEGFLSILEQRITKIQAISYIPEEHPSEIYFDDYLHFCNMMDECLSFLIIIERHLTRLPDPRRTELQNKFEELSVAVWSVLLDGSLRFLKVISTKELLPVGTRHIFVHELRTLHDAEKNLKQEKYEKYLDKNVIARRKTAERILNEVIERAPRLLQFGE